MKVSKISVTPDAEKTIGYIARVSNPNNQDNPNVKGLLKYCIKHGHWSVFEQAHLTLEIETTRGLAAQIQDVSYIREDIPLPELRSQDDKNRQNSVDDVDPAVVERFHKEIRSHFNQSIDLYKSMLHAGIAKECARFVLPLSTPTRIYMTGSARSWIHYIDLRSAHGTQKEHMDIAEACRSIFVKEFPTIAEALGWI